ncbi:MAG: hypothetical protein AAF682_19720 [Planctomycetota bacterium]
MASDFVRVQRGVTDYGSSGDVGFAGVSAVVLDRAFNRITNTRHSNAGDAAGGPSTLTNVDLGETAAMAASTLAAFQRYAGGANVDHRIHWEVLEYTGAAGGPDEWIVRNVTEHTIADGTTDHTTAAVAGVSDWTDCVAVVTGIRNDRAAAAWDSSTVTAEVQSDSTLRVRRGDGTGELKVTIAVVEFLGSNWSVTTFGGAVTSTGRFALAMGAAVARWDQAMILGGIRIPSGEVENDEVGGLFLPSATELDEVDVVLSTLADNPGGGGYVAFGYVLSNPGITVLHDNSFDGGLTRVANTDTTEVETIPAEVLADTMLLVSAASGGSTAAYPRAHIGYHLASTTSVELWRSAAGSAVEWAMQVVAFRRTSRPSPTQLGVGVPAVTVSQATAQAPAPTAVAVGVPAVSVELPTAQAPAPTQIAVGVPAVTVELDTGQAPAPTPVTVGVPAVSLDLPTAQSPGPTQVAVGVPPVTVGESTLQAPAPTAVAVGVPPVSLELPTAQAPAPTQVAVGVPAATVSQPTAQSPTPTPVTVGVPAVTVGQNLYTPAHAGLDYRAALGGTNNGKQFLDVYHPPGTPPESGWPCVVWPLNNGFTSSVRVGSIEGDSLGGKLLAAGFAVIQVETTVVGVGAGGGLFRSPVDPEYDLDGGGDDFPLVDAMWATQYARANAATLGIDPSRLAHYGTSAGGQCALWAAGNPDVADPTNPIDQRRHSSRGFAVIGWRVQSWWNGIVQTQAGAAPFGSFVECVNLRDEGNPSVAAGDFGSASAVHRLHSSACYWMRQAAVQAANSTLPVFLYADGTIDNQALGTIGGDFDAFTFLPTYQAGAATGLRDRHDPRYVAWLMGSLRLLDSFHDTGSKLLAAAAWTAPVSSPAELGDITPDEVYGDEGAAEDRLVELLLSVTPAPPTSQTPEPTAVTVGVPIVPQVDDGGPITNLEYHPPFASGPVSTAIEPMRPTYTGATSVLFSVLPSLWFAFQAPPEDPVDVANADFEVQGPGVTGTGSGAVVRLSDGMVFSGQNYPLAYAISISFPGAVIRVNSPGQQCDPGGSDLQIGGGDAGIKPYRADWESGPYAGQPIDVTIVGANGGRADWISAVGFEANIGGAPSGGIDGIRFQDLTMRPKFAQQAVSSPLGTYNGLARFYDVNIIGRGDGGDGGYGIKWGMRAQGLMRWDLRRVHFGALQDGTQPPGSLDQPGIQEHCGYFDGPQGDCFFLDCTMEGTWRTMFQIVNRRFEQDAAGGQSGFGVLLFERCHAYNIHGQGGGAFTIAGHLGTVIIRDSDVREGPWNEAAQDAYSAVVVNVDEGKGLYLNPNGFPTDRVVIQGLTVVLPHASRDSINVSGTEHVEVHDFTAANINGRYAFDFNGTQELGDLYPNGFEGFYLPDPVSSYAGFPASNKVRKFDAPLPDAEIDALRADPEELPPGLSLDSVSGEITGTPSEEFDPALRYVRAENAQGWDSFALGFWFQGPPGPTSQAPPPTAIAVGVPPVMVDSTGPPLELEPSPTAVTVGVPSVSVSFEAQSEIVKVQRGVLDYGAAEDIGLQPLPDGSVDIGRAFPRITNARHSNAGRTALSDDLLSNPDLGETCNLPVGGLLFAAQRYASGEDELHRVFWEVAEWIGPQGAGHPDEFQVHAFGEITFAPGQAEVTTTPFEGIVDTARAVVLVTGARSAATNPQWSASQFTAELLPSKRVVLRRGSSVGDAVVSIAIVELVGTGWTVRRVVHTFAADGAWEQASLGSAVAKWAHAFIVGSLRVPSGQDDNNEGGVVVRPGALDEVELRLAAGADLVGSGGYVFEGWVLENASLTVLHDDSFDGSLAQMGVTDATLEHVLPAAVDPASTLCFVRSVVGGNAADYPIPHVGYRLKSSARVELWRSRVGARADWSLQLVQFRRVVEPAPTPVVVGVPAVSVDLPTHQAPEPSAVTVGVPAVSVDLQTGLTPDPTAVVVGVPAVELDRPTAQVPAPTAVLVGVPAAAVELPTAQAPAPTSVAVGVPAVSVELATSQAPAPTGVPVGVPAVQVTTAGQQSPDPTPVVVGVPAVSVSYDTSQAPEPTAIVVGVPAVTVQAPQSVSPAPTSIVVGVPDVGVELPTAQSPPPVSVSVGTPEVRVDLPTDQSPDPVPVVVGVPAPTVSLPTSQSPAPVPVVVGVPAPTLLLPTDQAPPPVPVVVGVPAVQAIGGGVVLKPEPTRIEIGIPNPVLLGIPSIEVDLELDLWTTIQVDLDLE